MPYNVEKMGSKYAIVKPKNGKVVGKSDTKEKAKASIRARYASDAVRKGEFESRKDGLRKVLKGFKK